MNKQKPKYMDTLLELIHSSTPHAISFHEEDYGTPYNVEWSREHRGYLKLTNAVTGEYRGLYLARDPHIQYFNLAMLVEPVWKRKVLVKRRRDCAVIEFPNMYEALRDGAVDPAVRIVMSPDAGEVLGRFVSELFLDGHLPDNLHTTLRNFGELISFDSDYETIVEFWDESDGYQPVHWFYSSCDEMWGSNDDTLAPVLNYIAGKMGWEVTTTISCE